MGVRVASDALSIFEDIVAVVCLAIIVWSIYNHHVNIAKDDESGQSASETSGVSTQSPSATNRLPMDFYECLCLVYFSGYFHYSHYLRNNPRNESIPV